MPAIQDCHLQLHHYHHHHQQSALDWTRPHHHYPPFQHLHPHHQHNDHGEDEQVANAGLYKGHQAIAADYAPAYGLDTRSALLYDERTIKMKKDEDVHNEQSLQ